MNDSLLAAKVGRVQRELPLLISEFDSLIRHLGFMIASADSWRNQPRELRRQLDDLTRRSIALRSKAMTTPGEAGEVVAVVPSGPPRVVQPGQCPPPFVNVASIKVQGRRLDGPHARLESAIESLRLKVRQLETAPGLYGQEAGTGLEVLLDNAKLIRDVAKRWRRQFAPGRDADGQTARYISAIGCASGP